MSQYNKRCTGTLCDWRGHCEIALRPREYHESLIVPLKENTADNCDMYVAADKSWGEGADRD